MRHRLRFLHRPAGRDCPVTPTYTVPWQVLTLETREAHRTIARSRIRGRAYDDFNAEALVIAGRVSLAGCTHIPKSNTRRGGEGEGSSIYVPQQWCVNVYPTWQATVRSRP